MKVHSALEVDSVLLSSVMEKCLVQQPIHILRRFSPFSLDLEKCAQSMLQVRSLPEMAPARDGTVHDGTALSGSIGFFAHICACWIAHNSLSVLWTAFLQQRRFGPLYLAVTCAVLFSLFAWKALVSGFLREMTSRPVSVFSAHLGTTVVASSRQSTEDLDFHTRPWWFASLAVPSGLLPRGTLRVMRAVDTGFLVSPCTAVRTDFEQVPL